MTGSEDPPGSQYAISHPSPASKSPRPAKRPRSKPLDRESRTAILIDDDEPTEVTQTSPSKPRTPKSSILHVPLYVLSDSEDDASIPLQFPVGTPPCPPANSGKVKVIPWTSQRATPVARVPAESSHSNAQHHVERFYVASPGKGFFSGPTSAFRAQGHVAVPEVQLPDDFEYPSPPPSSSSDSDCLQDIGVVEQKDSGLSGPSSTLQKSSHPTVPSRQTAKALRPPKLIETFEPVVLSQDSAYFSFSRQSQEVQAEYIRPSQQNVQGSSQAQGGDGDTAVVGLREAPKRYYTKAFDYVLSEVLKRYSDILRQFDVELATLMQTQLSQNALRLFVRVYRRKPRWFRSSELEENYGLQIDLEKAIAELCEHKLVISSHYAAKATRRVSMLLARQLLPILGKVESVALCSSLVNGGSLKRLGKHKLLSELQKILREEQPDARNKKKFKQSTLTGLSPSERLADAIFKTAGHCIKIPEYVLVSLERIHFLFFLEDGHDSPNILLADTGKAKFPEYECQPQNRIFPSAQAFEDYEAAIQLELRLNHALEYKDFEKAASIGSIAELEIREYFDLRRGTEVAREENRNFSLTNSAMRASLRTARRRSLDQERVAEQLRHPFFRRYTAQWVHVRAAWHSVHALERLSEHENAVRRLQLLLATGLVPRRRGKCLNRLTINLSKHLGQLQEPLDIILAALRGTAPQLHFGDRISLVNRGISIHRKIALPAAEEKAMRSVQTKSGRKKAAAADVIANRPPLLIQALSRAETRISVRKIFGKSVQVSRREQERKADQNRRDPWRMFNFEGSRDSIASASTQETSSMLGKSTFVSFGSKRKSISVELYCLEWYLGKEGWCGVHDEGAAIRFLYCLLFWENALFAYVEDVFQTPYQDHPLDLFTEAFYPSRKDSIDARLAAIARMESRDLRDLVFEQYSKYDMTRAIGCAWKTYSAEQLSHIGAGLGGRILSHCCKLLSQDYAYWGGGLPDLTLWKVHGTEGDKVFETRLVEAKSARDTLSERQRAWLIELQLQGADCEVCKVVEKVTAKNSSELESSTLDAVAISAIDAAVPEDGPS